LGAAAGARPAAAPLPRRSGRPAHRRHGPRPCAAARDSRRGYPARSRREALETIAPARPRTRPRPPANGLRHPCAVRLPRPDSPARRRGGRASPRRCRPAPRGSPVCAARSRGGRRCANCRQRSQLPSPSRCADGTTPDRACPGSAAVVGGLPAFDVSVHWCWRFAGDPGNRSLRELIVAMFRERRGSATEAVSHAAA